MVNQFLSRDMYNGALADMALATDPFTGNRYTFGAGNPISNIELDGHIFPGGGGAAGYPYGTIGCPGYHTPSGGPTITPFCTFIELMCTSTPSGIFGSRSPSSEGVALPRGGLGGLPGVLGRLVAAAVGAALVAAAAREAANLFKENSNACSLRVNRSRRSTVRCRLTPTIRWSRKGQHRP